MFEDLNVLYRAQQGLRGDPAHEAALAARWAGFMAWTDAEFDAACAAKTAYMFANLDRRPPDARAQGPAAKTAYMFANLDRRPPDARAQGPAAPSAHAACAGRSARRGIHAAAAHGRARRSDARAEEKIPDAGSRTQPPRAAKRMRGA